MVHGFREVLPGATLNLPSSCPAVSGSRVPPAAPAPCPVTPRYLRLLPDALPKALARPARFIPLFPRPAGRIPGPTASCPVPAALPRVSRRPRQHRWTSPAASRQLSRALPGIPRSPGPARCPPRPRGSLTQQRRQRQRRPPQRAHGRSRRRSRCRGGRGGGGGPAQVGAGPSPPHPVGVSRPRADPPPGVRLSPRPTARGY